ncbi:MAG TPA: DUF4124 domain-containing protein [Burkholderiaceae bacterium]|nr:DUF4124 domain-containing protein [Burkholderiaceae bacterium]
MTMIRLPKCPLPKRALSAIAAMLVGLAFASTAHAQSGTWKWLDAQGRAVYSDRPPPAGARVTQLKAPGGRSPAGVSSTTPAGPRAESAEDSAATGSHDTERSADAPPSWVERERQSRQRATERAEAETRQAQASQQAADQQRACDETRAGLRALESGMRMHAVDDKGERIALDDDERARRAATLRRVLNQNCARPPT